MTDSQHPKEGMTFQYLKDLPPLHIGDILESVNAEEFEVVGTSPLWLQGKHGWPRCAIHMSGIRLRVAQSKHSVPAVPVLPDPTPMSPVTVTQRVDYQIHTGIFDGLGVSKVDVSESGVPAVRIIMPLKWASAPDLRKLSKHMADLADALEART